MELSWFLQNRHKGKPCHPSWQPSVTRWRKAVLLQSIEREKEKSRNAHQPPGVQGHRPVSASSSNSSSSSGGGGGGGGGNKTCPSALCTTQICTLNCSKLVTTCSTQLVVVTLSFKWCLDLHKDLCSLTLQSPGLRSLSIAVMEPDDGRWEPQKCLDLADAEKIWFPSLRLLSLTTLPMPTIRVSGSTFPRLKHLTVSNTGFLMQRPPYSTLTIGPFAALKILEVKEVAVRDQPMDLGSLAACSPQLKTMVVSEFWGVGPVQTHIHTLRLPSCVTLYIRNSLNVMNLNIWAPAVRHLSLLCLRLKGIQLGPGGPAHLPQHAMDKLKGRYPAAKLVTLRNILDEKAIVELERHSQISEVGYDDEALEVMRLILGGVQRELSVLRAISASCPPSPGRKPGSPSGGRQTARPFSARP
ncbi:hypothetical protein DUNSADRAFT_14383 [Dunaliella salina]|uniref:Encoded protein n=1 Tax=Dunaliella salina TaxID=3046 RepID=A0ABQ7G7E9_DUNSA|nr:hypothetical protein DUNSADRAFT_14383 [Dunaliella salina]KAF5830533.1 hypothetical protein DUNSADRAFT_14383 [Dunaliella salina]|eukprot:KAF5830532.1 hypothetical protein DUNSADRAFT_14383 [Dunaliella salina]